MDVAATCLVPASGSSICFEESDSDETKYFYVVSALDQNTASRLIDLLEQPPHEDKYAAIKERLLTTFTLTPSQRAQQLLHMPTLGDRLPTALMDEMLALLGSEEPCFLFKELFLEKMPAAVRTGLAGKDFPCARVLAQQADALLLASRKDEEYEVLKVRRSRFSSTTPQQVRNAQKFCFYHRRFGKNARQCCPPCAFRGNEQADRL